jgi:hypothetical protein
MGGRVWWYGLALAATVWASSPAVAANPFELNFWLFGPRYEGNVPLCDSEPALWMISRNFAQKEERFWNSPLTIEGYEKIREIAYRPWAPHAIPRRFCSAFALVSDGLKHPIYYSIGESTSITGGSWGVEWCVVGLDRNWAYNPNCKMARP